MVQITNSVKLVLTGLTFVVAALCLPVQGNAQRVEDYLRKADLNDDGKIEPSETTMPLRRYLIGKGCLLYTSPSPRDLSTSRMPSSA